MPAKNLKYALLYDCYGGLLSEKQGYALEMYYCVDLSLSEISEHMGITRQGVRDLIKHAEEELDRLERCLGLYEKNNRIRDYIQEISKSADGDADIEKIRALCEKALSLLDT